MVIQASLNKLTGAISSGLRNMAMLGRGKEILAKIETPEKGGVSPSSGVGLTSIVGNKGNIVKIGRSNLGYRRYKADTAALSGNDMIYQKARSSFDVASRLSILGGNE